MPCACAAEVHACAACTRARTRSHMRTLHAPNALRSHVSRPLAVMPKDRPTEADVTSTVFFDIEIGGEAAGRNPNPNPNPKPNPNPNPKPKPNPNPNPNPNQARGQ